jgi:hypothetical protein
MGPARGPRTCHLAVTVDQRRCFVTVAEQAQLGSLFTRVLPASTGKTSWRSAGEVSLRFALLRTSSAVLVQV